MSDQVIHGVPEGGEFRRWECMACAGEGSWVDSKGRQITCFHCNGLGWYFRWEKPPAKPIDPASCRFQAIEDRVAALERASTPGVVVESPGEGRKWVLRPCTCLDSRGINPHDCYRCNSHGWYLRSEKSGEGG